jgi:hypothetical protein
VCLNDEWRQHRDLIDNTAITRATVFVNANSGWHDLSLIITKTTVTDFTKIVAKLKAFFDEQFKSGACVLFNWRLILDLVSPIQHLLTSDAGMIVWTLADADTSQQQAVDRRRTLSGDSSASSVDSELAVRPNLKHHILFSTSGQHLPPPLVARAGRDHGYPVRGRLFRFAEDGPDGARRRVAM